MRNIATAKLLSLWKFAITIVPISKNYIKAVVIDGRAESGIPDMFVFSTMIPFIVIFVFKFKKLRGEEI